MKRRHILFLFYLVGGIVAASCSSATYTGEEDIRKPDVGYEQEPIPITLRIGNASYVTETRSTGIFGSLSGQSSSEADLIQWNEARFYVYAFAKGKDIDLTTRWDDPRNVNESICLVDATRPGKKGGVKVEDLQEGKETYIEQEGYSYLYWKKKPTDNDSPIYYNIVDRERPYNFFAYYVDDAIVSNFQRERNRIYFDVTINGQQDLMAAMAVPTKAQIDKLNSNPNKSKVLEYAFSAYSGNYDLAPTFEFRHQLTCLKFEIYPGGELEDEAQSECYRLEVASIKAVNPQTKGVFTVATNDADAYPLGITAAYPSTQGTSFTVQKKEVKEGAIIFQPTTGNLSASAPFWEEDRSLPYYNRHGQALEGSVLLLPQSSYTLEVRLDGNLEGGNYQGETLRIDVYPPAGSETFESGKCYVVRLGIFGRQLIKSDVSIGQWQQGGDIEIKPVG